MPIPETPYTRREAYLNAVATGDSSGIPETPYTREEMYLDAIARNGGGGGGGGGGSSTLSGLTDVDISNPSDGQTLVYDATSGKWENGSGSGGGFTLLEGTYDNNAVTTNVNYAALYGLLQTGIVILHFSPGDDSNAVYELITAFSFYEGEYLMTTASGMHAGGAANDTVVFSVIL